MYVPVPPGGGRALVQIQMHHFEDHWKEADFLSHVVSFYYSMVS